MSDPSILGAALAAQLGAGLDTLGYCKAKAYLIMAGFSDGQLLTSSDHKKGTMNRLELVIYLTRHIQHHATQLGLRLQLLDGTEMPWFSKGSSLRSIKTTQSGGNA